MPRRNLILAVSSLALTMSIWLTTSPARVQAAKVDPPPVTWDSIESRIKWEADQGFSGVVFVAKDGKVVIHNAYGLANREKKIPMRPDTIFAIGSTPIDFTKAGILLLAEHGKLALTDPITKYFKDAPDDKQSITIRH